MGRALTTVGQIMTAPVSVAASETVWTATEIVRRGRLAGLPVVDGDRVLGIVTAVHLLRQPLYRRVSEVMRTGVISVGPELTLLQAYPLFTRQGVDVLPVVEDGRLVGTVALTALLEARGQETDPLTGLPWSTALRAWAADSLARGQEVAILFIDLDSFHLVNRALGHVAGDDILRSVARLLSDIVEPSTDALCRYGGDEFAIATTRGQAGVNALAQTIRESVAVRVEIDGTPRPVTVSVGIAGGRRVETRAASHIAATVDDLLTLASRGSTLAKDAGQGVVLHTRPAEEEARRNARHPHPREVRVRLAGVTVYTAAGRSTASVELTLGRRAGAGTAAGRAYGRGVAFLVAEATLQAIAQTLGEDQTFTLEDLAEVPCKDGGLVVVVLSSGSGTPDRFVGAARGRDVVQAVPKAILDALNRRLARPVADLLGRETPG